MHSDRDGQPVGRNKRGRGDGWPLGVTIMTVIIITCAYFLEYSGMTCRNCATPYRQLAPVSSAPYAPLILLSPAAVIGRERERIDFNDTVRLAWPRRLSCYTKCMKKWNRWIDDCDDCDEDDVLIKRVPFKESDEVLCFSGKTIELLSLEMLVESSTKGCRHPALLE